MLKPACEAKVEKARPTLSPVLMKPNMMIQKEKKVRTVVVILVSTSINNVTPNDANTSRGSSLTRYEKKNDVGLYPPSEISRYAMSRWIY
jgi:hypothetical protein